MITLKEYRKYEIQTNEFYNVFKEEFENYDFSKKDLHHELVVRLIEAGEKNIPITSEYVKECLHSIWGEMKKYNKVFVRS